MGMGLIDLIKKQILNTAESVRSGASKTLDGLNSYIKSVQQRVSPQKPRTETTNLRELSDDDFDRIARERGYVKRDGSYRQRTPTMATEGESQPLREGEEYEEELPFSPLTKEEQDALQFVYFAEYTTDVLITFKNGQTAFLSEMKNGVPPMSRTTKRHGSIEAVEQEIQFIMESFKTTGGSGSLVIIQKVIYRLNQKTGETVVVG